MQIRVARLLVAVVLSAPTAAAQTTWYVDVNGVAPGSGAPADPYTSIQHAIDQAATVNGDTLLVAPGRYVENVVVTKELTIRAIQGPEATSIDGNRSGSVVTYGSIGGPGQVLEGFTLTNGLALRGGGIDGVSVAPTLRNLFIVGNEATIQGGGVNILVDLGTTTLSRCVIAENAAPVGGGLYMFYAFDVLIEHCTIANNVGRTAQAIYMGEFCNPVVHNSIVWGSGPSSITQAGSASPQFSWSNVEGGQPGAGMIDARPLFFGASGNYYLQPGSPCIDTGDPQSPPDPDGSRADMGAYPFDPGVCGPTGIYCVAKVNSEGCSPAISISGVPSLSLPQAFRIDAVNVINNKAGILLYGFDWLTLPFQGGLLCVSPPIRRTSAQGSGGNPPPNDCSGGYSFDFNAYIQAGGDPSVVAGTVVYAQYWYRDKLAVNATGLSDAARFTLCP